MDYSDLTHIIGPAIVTHNGATFYTEGDIDVDIVQETFDVPGSMFGVIGRRIKSLPVGTVSFKPDGQITAGRVAAVFPYTVASVGKSIHPAVDLPLVIWSIAGYKYTFARAGVSGSPSVVLSAVKTGLDGSMQFICLHSRSGDVTDSDNFLKIESAAFTDVTFDQTKVITPGYTAAYGATPHDVMEALDGFKIGCPIKTTLKSIDRYGVVDCMLGGVGPATCEFAPAGLADADFLSLVNFDGADVRLPGQATLSDGTDLVITAADGSLTVTLPKCLIAGAKMGFGPDKERHGVVQFFNSIAFTAGIPAKPITFTFPA